MDTTSASLPAPAEPAAASAEDTVAQRLMRELFEDEGLNQLFVHARNVLTGTLFVAAGLFATHRPQSAETLGMWTVHFAGYVVATLGVMLLLLNLIDGLRRLSRRAYPLALRMAAGFVYFALTMRLVQVIVMFRGAV